MKALIRSRFTWLLAITVLSFCAVIALARRLNENTNVKDIYNHNLHAELVARQATSLQDLTDRFRWDQYQYLILTPPAADFFLVQPGGQVPILDLNTFPDSFVDGLAGTVDKTTALRTFPIWVREDSEGDLLIESLEGNQIATIKREWSYSPDWLAREFNPAFDTYEQWYRDWLVECWSPQRLTMRYDLILGKEDLVRTVWRQSIDAAMRDQQPEVGGGGAMMRSEWSGSVTNIKLVDILTTEEGIEVTVAVPDDFTNDISLLTCDHSRGGLIDFWWDLAVTTNLGSTNTVSWVDTGSTNEGASIRFYRAINADLDSDSDGDSDGFETHCSHTDPSNAASHAIAISGSVTHSNTPQSGPIYVVAVTSSNSWSLIRSDELSSPGTYSISALPNQQSYWVRAWRDWCGNGEVDPWEATGVATNCPMSLTDSASNIVVALVDPSTSIAGTLSYTGRQSGATLAIAVTASSSWATNAADVLSSPGVYYIGDLSQTDYWAKAWIDADADGVFDSDREASGTWTNNPIDLSNSVWGIDYELTDVDGDGDGMPDWWEFAHFGDTNQASSGDYDGDTMPNGWEYTYALCPTNDVDAMEDLDGDDYFNVYEYHHGSDPSDSGNTPSTPGGGGSGGGTPSPTVTVVASGGTAIQEALDSATNAYDIVLAEAGTYTGASNRNLSFPSHPVLLLGEDGASSTILDCQSAARGAQFIQGQTNHACLSGFTITGGSAAKGGGLLVSNAHPTIYACIITNCVASNDGGGIYLYASDASVQECVLENNSAADDGGGAFLDQKSDAAFVYCVFTGNMATNDGGGVFWDDGSDGSMTACLLSDNTAGDDGGGIRCRDKSDPVIAGCTIDANLAVDNGGGIFANDSADPELTLCLIRNNTAYDHGGGFYGKDTEAQLSQCTVSYNTAVDGGGIGFISSTVSIAECAIVDNWAHIDGGGIRAKESQPTVRSCLIARNRAFGLGGGVQAKGSTMAFSLENCTLTANEARLGGGGISTSEGASATNLNAILWGNVPDQISGTVTTSYSCVQGGTAGDGILTNNPALAPVTFRLLSTSSCTNAGTNATWMTSALDIDGESRIAGSVVDIGADEFIDSDDDGMSDAWETLWFGDLDMDGSEDLDGDGLTTAQEAAYDTSPTSSDTDGDGASDGAEVNGSSSPTTPLSDSLRLFVGFGDVLGGSKSEKYQIEITGDTGGFTAANTAFGSLRWVADWFDMGESYDITFTHIASDYTNYPPPDYDHAIYMGTSMTNVVPPTNSMNGAHDDWIFADGFVIHDPDNFLGSHHYDEHTTTFVASNKEATLYVLLTDLDADVDWDGDIGDAEDEIAEDDPPGALVAVNWDDDNTNGTADYLDSSYDTNENDLAEMRLSVGPTNLDVGTVVLELTTGTNYVSVWTNRYKGGSPLLGVGATSSTNWIVGTSGAIADLGEFPYTNLWVEGITNTPANTQVCIELRYEDTNGITRCSDTNLWSVIKVEVEDPGEVAFTGATQNVRFQLTPGSWTNCTWQISPDLWTNGPLFADGPSSPASNWYWVGTSVWVNAGPTATNFLITVHANPLTDCKDAAGLVVSREISWTPAGSDIYVWEPVKDGNFKSDFVDDIATLYQGWGYSTNSPVTWFKDPSTNDTDCGDCTLANLKAMKNGGIVVVLAHGLTGAVEVVRFNGSQSKTNAEAWVGTDTNYMQVAYGPHPLTNYWSVLAHPSWFQTYWRADRNQRNAIAFLQVCNSADGAISIASSLGGETVFAVRGPGNAWYIDQYYSLIVDYMNGTAPLGEPWKRPAKVAYDSANVAANGIELVGSGRSTLCPAPQCVFPDSELQAEAEWGCIAFDTYMDSFTSAGSAVTPTVGTVDTRSWGGDGTGSFFVEFEFTGKGITMEAVSSKCLSKVSVYPGRPLDGDAVAPMSTNGQSKTWSW